MKFPTKCRTKKLGMKNTILGSFCSCLNWEGANIRPQIRPRKTPEAYFNEWDPFTVFTLTFPYIIIMYL